MSLNKARAGGAGTLATCWAGECSQAAIAEALNPAQKRHRGPWRPEWTPDKTKPARGPGNGSRADFGRFSASSAKAEAVGSPVSDERHPPRGTPRKSARIRRGRCGRVATPSPSGPRTRGGGGLRVAAYGPQTVQGPRPSGGSPTRTAVAWSRRSRRWPTGPRRTPGPDRRAACSTWIPRDGLGRIPAACRSAVTAP